MFETELLAIAEQFEKITGIAPSRNQHDLLNPCIHERLDGVVDHRPVIDR